MFLFYVYTRQEGLQLPSYYVYSKFIHSAWDSPASIGRWVSPKMQ